MAKADPLADRPLTDYQDELITIVRMLMRQDPAVKGDLPAPSIESPAEAELDAK